MKCPLCDSHRFVPDGFFRDQGQYSDGTLGVAVHANPSALIFKGTAEAKLQVAVCCDCGFVEMRAVGDLEAIWKAYASRLQERPADEA